MRMARTDGLPPQSHMHSSWVISYVSSDLTGRSSTVWLPWCSPPVRVRGGMWCHRCRLTGCCCCPRSRQVTEAQIHNDLSLDKFMWDHPSARGTKSPRPAAVSCFQDAYEVRGGLPPSSNHPAWRLPAARQLVLCSTHARCSALVPWSRRGGAYSHPACACRYNCPARLCCYP